MIDAPENSAATSIGLPFGSSAGVISNAAKIDDAMMYIIDNPMCEPGHILVD